MRLGIRNSGRKTGQPASFADKLPRMATVDSTAPIADAPAADVGEPVPPGRRRPRGRVAGEGLLPARAERLQPRPHQADRPRPAAAAARRLRRVRADLQHAAAPHQGRLHARPGGQPLRHRRPPGELPLARVELRRPDPAARRRPADDRRRLPRPRPGDHAARLPPRAGRGLDRGDAGRGRGGDRRPPPRHRGRRLRLDAPAGDADRDAGAARPRPRRRRQGRRRGGPLRGGARLLRHRLRPAPAARPRLALAPPDGLPRRPRRDRLRGDRPPPRRPRQRPRATSSACWSRPAARTARPSPTARSATR